MDLHTYFHIQQSLHREHEVIERLFSSVPVCLTGALDGKAFCAHSLCPKGANCHSNVSSWMHLLYVYVRDHFGQEQEIMDGNAQLYEHKPGHADEHIGILRSIKSLIDDYAVSLDPMRAAACLKDIGCAIQSHTSTLDSVLLGILKAQTDDVDRVPSSSPVN